MPTLRRTVRMLEDRGASAVEYGLLVAAIAAVTVVTVFGLGALVKGAFSRTCSVMAVGPASLGDPVKDCGADPPVVEPTDPPADPGGDPVVP
jgi:pilus assembly protein Flp/PilA